MLKSREASEKIVGHFQEAPGAYLFNGEPPERKARREAWKRTADRVRIDISELRFRLHPQASALLDFVILIFGSF